MRIAKWQTGILLVCAAGLALGVLIGNAAKALMGLDPSVRWMFAGSFLFFSVGAGFISSFNKAEREHETRLAAFYRGRPARYGLSSRSGFPVPSPPLRRVK